LPKFHLCYVRDGAPVACDCQIGHDHDAESLTYAQACVEVDQLIARFYRDLAYVAPELYEEKFTLLAEHVKSVITRVGV
jgi:hypothetical protein